MHSVDNMAKTSENPKSSMEGVPFEQALKELEAIVRKLEGGSGDLEASINDYVRGTELKEYCQEKLKSARLKVESILKTADGVATKPFDEENT
jgi:exodeoxyribonuclease VII small subunit